MKISLKGWLVFIIAAIFCFGLWYKFGYPQFTSVDLSIDKKEAIKKARLYLSSRGVDSQAYLKAVVFESDDLADRYLQKTLGLKREEEFINQYNYELFYWKIRFFKELQKEEYVIQISPKSGAIVNFQHLIEDTEPRKALSQEVAREKAEEFLKSSSGIDLSTYELHEQKTKRYEKRIDYDFSWEKKGLYIPWPEGGTAKLLTGITVSGEEIRNFSKSKLDIPEKFRRYIENQFILGKYLNSLSFAVLIILLVFSIFIVVKMKYAVAIRLCKKWYISLGLSFLIINIADIFNNIQNIIIAYPTSTSLPSLIGIYLLKLMINLIFLSFIFVIPGLAGELLRSETLPDNKYSSFLHYIRSTFYSRGMTQSIILGYLLFFIFLGFQATIFHLGHQYLGVWREWWKLTQLSSASSPLLGAFVLGTSAAMSEEIIFRLFGISLAKRYLKNTIGAVVLLSVIWGFCHTEYPIFPVWFRGIEVSLMGLLYGFIFIRYGIIPLIVTHYLFDVFWCTAAYILGHSQTYLFISSLSILFIPAAFAVASFFLNRSEKENEIRILLDATQKYNLDILKAFVSLKKSQSINAQVIKSELLRHDWDIILIDLAIGDVFKD